MQLSSGLVRLVRWTGEEKKFEGLCFSNGTNEISFHATLADIKDKYMVSNVNSTSIVFIALLGGG